MSKLSITNRKGQKLSVLLNHVPQPKGLAFVMHGLGGCKEQPHLQAMVEAFLEASYTVVRFDTTNTFGESDGDYADATTTNYYEDLEDVISWAAEQSWYREPFILAGHSIGGLCVGLYAEKYPEKVKALAPISTVVSGALSMEAKRASGELDMWQKTGWRVVARESTPGSVKRLKWSHMEDRLQYDLLPNIAALTMPVLLIVGERDDSALPAHQRMLYDHLPGKKEIHVIKSGPHTFREAKHLEEIKNIFKKWLANI